MQYGLLESQNIPFVFNFSDGHIRHLVNLLLLSRLYFGCNLSRREESDFLLVEVGF